LEPEFFQTPETKPDEHIRAYLEKLPKHGDGLMDSGVNCCCSLIFTSSSWPGRPCHHGFHPSTSKTSLCWEPRWRLPNVMKIRRTHLANSSNAPGALSSFAR